MMIVGCCCHDDGCDDSSFDVSLLASFSLTFYRRHHRQQHCLRTFVLGAMLRAPVNMNRFAWGAAMFDVVGCGGLRQPFSLFSRRWFDCL